MIAHFYHVWADGDWEGPAVGGWKLPGDAHVAALTAAGLRPELFVVGLVGAVARRRAARAWWRRAGVADMVEFVEADSGFEQVTLRALRSWAKAADPGIPVLYAHSKGAYNLSAVTVAHREAMTAGVVGRWREAVAALGGHDVAGCFWEPRAPAAHFTGNFWWARAGYVAGLPEVPETDRFAAELWLGAGGPSACELAEFTYGEMVEAIIGRAEPERRGAAVIPGACPLGGVLPAPQIRQGWAGRM